MIHRRCAVVSTVERHHTGPINPPHITTALIREAGPVKALPSFPRPHPSPARDTIAVLIHGLPQQFISHVSDSACELVVRIQDTVKA